MSQLNQNTICHLREMARRGTSVALMFKELKNRLGRDASIVTIIDYMRSAFCLTVAEVKPLAALSRNEQRDIVDEALLHDLVMPEIDKHRGEWDT